MDKINEPNTQWHPAFCSAMKLELVRNKHDLHFISEYGLNTKPILIDLLVIRKLPDVQIENEIGRFFKGHNLFEYKSPDDSLSIDTFFKAVAYACLYKTSSPTIDGFKADDITITLVREQKPEKLMKQLTQAGLMIREVSAGIYHIQADFFFDIQLIVSKELNEADHIWLKSLTRNLSEHTARKLLIKMDDLWEKDDKEYADSVLQVAMSENQRIFLKIKEVPEVCEALRELMKPEMAEIETALAEKTAALEEKTAALEEKTAALEEKSAALEEKSAALEEKSAALEEKSVVLEETEAALAEKTVELTETVAVLEKRNAAIEGQKKQLAEKDARIRELEAMLLAAQANK